MSPFLRKIYARLLSRGRHEPYTGERLPVAHGSGRPSECMFCASRPDFQVTDPSAEKSAFVCDEHVGPFITTWTLARELLLVRL